MSTGFRKNANEDIRQYAKKKRVYLWELAAAFGVADSNFSKMLRKEFTDDQKKLAMQYIDEIAKGELA